MNKSKGIQYNLWNNNSWEKLTPVEELNGILFKRDDRFKVGFVNGGKLRQAFILIEKNLSLIKEKYGGVVVSPCSNKSPQSAIMGVVCKHFGLKCKVVTFKTQKPNLPLAIAQENGAELYGTKVGWNSVIEARAKELGGFNIKMGFASEDVIEANIEQVKNIPEELEYLIVPVGSAYNFISILKGLERYDKKVEKIIGVYIGKEPFKTIEENYKGNLKFELIKSPFSYSTSFSAYPMLDEIYEAKAYKWAVDNLDFNPSKKSLFWVVGKRDYNFPFKDKKLVWKDI